MKVKIGDTIYNSENQPIMLILSDKDKENISTMSTGDNKYASFSETVPAEDIIKWMGNENKS